MDTNTYRTTHIWERTLQTLRFIHAMTGETIVAILDRLAKQELERLQKEHREKRLKQVNSGCWLGPICRVLYLQS